MVYPHGFIPLLAQRLISLAGYCILEIWHGLAYDTQYAITDREYDLKIELKSTAILFGHTTFNYFIVASGQRTFDWYGGIVVENFTDSIWFGGIIGGGGRLYISMA